MATTIYYPDADPETSSVDGVVIGQSTNWNTAQTAATGDGVYLNNGYVRSRLNGDGVTFQIGRLFLLFDTSSLPDSAIISSATLSVYVDSKENSDNDGDDYIAVYSSDPASNTNLVTADYSEVGSTELSDTKDITSISTGAYLDFTLNATGIAAISKTGVSKFSLREGHDVLNHQYAGAADSMNDVTSATADSGSNKPKLTITYTLPQSGNPAFFSSGGLTIL